MKRTMSYSLAFLLAFLWVIPAGADELSDYNAQKKAVSSKLDSISSQKREVKRAIETKKDEKNALLAAEKKKQEELNKLKEQKENLEKLVNSIDEQLKQSEQKYTDQRELLKKRLKVMYENSSISFLQTLIESESLVDFYEKMQLLSVITQSDNQLVKELDEAKKDVEYKKMMKEQEKSNTELLAASKAKAINDLTVSRADVEADLEKYSSALEVLEKQEDALIKQSDEINQEIKKLMSKKKYSGGTMRWPAPSTSLITSGYGKRYHPILKKTKMHTGIDIGAKSGASIIAAAKGTVIKAEYISGYGNTVIIDHGGNIATLYAHCSKLLVSVGDEVDAGETIAKVGSTGLSTGPHLHFEVIKDGETTNPLKYVSAN